MTKLSESGPFLITTQNGKISQSDVKSTTWPKPQFIKYAVFLHFYSEQDPIWMRQQLNHWNFFRRLSIFVQSKNPNQCRIFHKKMMTKHTNIDHLINHLKSTIDQFQDLIKTYEPSLVNLKLCLFREANSAKQQAILMSKINEKLDHFDKIEREKQEIEDEKIKDELKPTDSNYPEEEKIKNVTACALPKMSINRPCLNISTFDDKINATPVSNYLFQLYNPSTRGNQISQKKQEQWSECHTNFMTYFSKLSNLCKEQADHF